MCESKNKKKGIPLLTPVLLYESGVHGCIDHTEMLLCCIYFE